MGGNYTASHLKKTTMRGRGGRGWQDGFIWSLWSIWLVWSVSFVWLEQTKRMKLPAASCGVSCEILRAYSAEVASATEGSPHLHPRSKLRGIRRRRINQRNKMDQINQTSSSTREKSRAMDYGFFAHRNPVSPWSVGVMRLRFAERKARALLYQDPPRITLVPPDDGPVGFFDGLFL